MAVRRYYSHTMLKTIAHKISVAMNRLLQSSLQNRASGRGAATDLAVLTDFQLELPPNQRIQKIRGSGELADSKISPLDGACRGRFGAPLDKDDSIVTPSLRISKEHTLYVALQATQNSGASALVRLEYAVGETSDRWSMLADSRVGDDALAFQQIEISLGELDGKTCKFRVVRTDSSKTLCHVALLRVCPPHRLGRINALSGYEFRMCNEAQVFSGTAYTHAMYGQSAPGSRNGVVRAAAITGCSGDAKFLETQADRIRERLMTLAPAPNEVAFNYAMRALGSLLPTTPPDFFARAKRLNQSKSLRILSICAGAARIEEQILDHCGGTVELTLLDASPDLIQRAADRLIGAHPDRRVECLIGDVNSGLPGDGLFDVIVCVSALHHVADLEVVLAQINQRLTDDGEFWSIGEQIGRNGNRLWPDAYAAANRVFSALPDRLRRNAHTGKIDSVLTDQDFSAGCFEGIRSEELEHLLESYLVPDHVYKRNAFLWRLVNAAYSDNFSLDRAEDLEHLRELIRGEALHWVSGGRSTELHGVYRKKFLR